MYCTPPEMRKARKQHRCMHCSEAIEIGEKYQRWMSVDDGKAQTNVMHPECLDALNDEYGSGYWEYTPYEGERPNTKLTGAAPADAKLE